MDPDPASNTATHCVSLSPTFEAQDVVLRSIGSIKCILYKPCCKPKKRVRREVQWYSTVISDSRLFNPRDRPVARSASPSQCATPVRSCSQALVLSSTDIWIKHAKQRFSRALAQDPTEGLPPPKKRLRKNNRAIKDCPSRRAVFADVEDVFNSEYATHDALHAVMRDAAFEQETNVITCKYILTGTVDCELPVDMHLSVDDFFELSSEN